MSSESKTNIFSTLKEKYKFLTNIFFKMLDNIINSSNYKYYISILLTFIFIVLVILTNLINIPNKYIQIITLFSGGILFSIFYFFVYRNEQNDNKQINIYSTSNKKIIKDNDVFNKENFILSVSNPIKNLIRSFGILIFSILIIISFIVIVYILYNKYEYLYVLTKLFLGFIIIIVILSIIAKLFSIVVKDCESTDNNIKRFLCIIKNLIFFIPCLLIILIDEINKDIKATPSSIFILFIILLILVLLFIGLPILFQFITTMNKHDLLGGKGPYYLDTKRTIGKYQEFSKYYKSNKNKLFPPNTEYKLLNEDSPQQFNIKALFGYLTDKKFEYKYTYSISFYLYLNPQPKNTSLAYNKETELFNYGNKPIIIYDGNKRKLLIKSKTQTNEGNQTDIIYETKNIKYQKWIFFTINYENNTIDVFIDGKLVGSKKNVPPFFENDTITIGEDNGIHGSIKDIYYYDIPRPPYNIEFLYNLAI